MPLLLEQRHALHTLEGSSLNRILRTALLCRPMAARNGDRCRGKECSRSAVSNGWLVLGTTVGIRRGRFRIVRFLEQDRFERPELDLKVAGRRAMIIVAHVGWIFSRTLWMIGFRHKSRLWRMGRDQYRRGGIGRAITHRAFCRTKRATYARDAVYRRVNRRPCAIRF